MGIGHVTSACSVSNVTNPVHILDAIAKPTFKKRPASASSGPGESFIPDAGPLPKAGFWTRPFY